MSLLEWLTRFWYRKFASRSQTFTKNLSFAKVLQQIRVRAYTKSHWQKMETEKSHDPNGLTEVELTAKKLCNSYRAAERKLGYRIELTETVKTLLARL